ncbi:MAG TPA: ABC transporter permease [Spirochaetota bacterium]|jgi:phospholipid/cholesterol/gamma-HCH transport system permease protein|nr:ABC transporter permease [Spirochaetota bacterium]HOK92794.1 ABC transporter permease [Spirochaetota bacterium]HON17034.1 ABC transporter permease [Spirochaetota bacterium]HOV08327.1 ABC transporter permease [Spirochaetota bacterium]HPD79140.1 ABC transporter permease [Spirochaetota bacterium]
MIENTVIKIGRWAIDIRNGVKDFSLFIKSIVTSFKSLRYIRFRSLYTIIINQTRFTGVDALSIVIIIALLLGATVIIQALTSLPKFGVEGFLGNLLVIIIARELGPLATTLIVIARSGSAIATEISVQKWSKEILAMELMGIDTKLFIVFPRIIASILSIMGLIIIFDVVAFIGGYLIALTVIYIPMDTFGQTLIDSFTFKDITAALAKSILFGIAVPLICCYYGFKPNSKFEIPIFVSKAVIRTLFVAIIVNIAISTIFYLI